MAVGGVSFKTGRMVVLGGAGGRGYWFQSGTYGRMVIVDGDGGRRY